jgi:16S rRNA (guanine527-N7)-methyltransferase
LIPQPVERLFEKSALLLGRPLTRTEIVLFYKYLSLITRWGRTFRLTAHRGGREVVEKLFFDSFLFLKVLPPDHSPLLDFGTGAGIPGIPLKIIDPGLDLTLLESQRRKVSFLSAVVRELPLERVRVIHGRAERLLEEIPDLSGSFQAVTARATGPLDKVASLASQFLRAGGTLVISGPPSSAKPEPLKTTFPGRWEKVRSPLHGWPRQFFLLQKAG